MPPNAKVWVLLTPGSILFSLINVDLAETRQALQTAIPSLTMGLAAAHQCYGQLNMCAFDFFYALVT